MGAPMTRPENDATLPRNGDGMPRGLGALLDLRNQRVTPHGNGDVVIISPITNRTS